MKKIISAALLFSLSTFVMAGDRFTVSVCGQQVDIRDIDSIRISLGNHVKGLAALDGIKRTTVCVEKTGTYVLYTRHGIRHYDRTTR